MATEIKKIDALEIYKLPEGGFLVRDCYRPEGFSSTGPCFASTTIEEALRFVKKKLEVKH